MLQRECVRFHLAGLPGEPLGTAAVRVDGGLSSPGVGPPEQHCRHAGRPVNEERHTAVRGGVRTPCCRVLREAVMNLSVRRNTLLPVSSQVFGIGIYLYLSLMEC